MAILRTTGTSISGFVRQRGHVSARTEVNQVWRVSGRHFVRTCRRLAACVVASGYHAGRLFLASKTGGNSRKISKIDQFRKIWRNLSANERERPWPVVRRDQNLRRIRGFFSARDVMCGNAGRTNGTVTVLRAWSSCANADTSPHGRNVTCGACRRAPRRRKHAGPGARAAPRLARATSTRCNLHPSQATRSRGGLGFYPACAPTPEALTSIALLPLPLELGVSRIL